MKLIHRALPPGSRRRILAGRIKSRVITRGKNITINYSDWIKEIEPNTVGPLLKRQDNKISIVVPCYNTPERYIEALVKSLQGQTYSNWQLCIADGSTNPRDSENITKYCDDPRIEYIRVDSNLGIAGNTNKAIGAADGDYVGFLDHDDILAPWALNEMAAAINKTPQAELFYSDEDRLSEDGKIRMSPLFKPNWSPELFFCANYLAHFLVIKRSLLTELKNLRTEYDGSQDYDLVLRALDHSPQIIHIPKVLYHMRMAASSTASVITVKNYAHVAGNKALADYLRRHKIKAKVLEIPDRPTNHHILYELDKKPLASIIIPFKDKAELLKNCLQSIEEKTFYKNYEIILVSNNSTEAATFDYLKKLEKNQKIKIYEYNKPFNYSALNNFGRKKAKGEVLVFLNNDTEVISAEWLDELLRVAKRPDIGAVGPLLLYPDGTIQHAGVVVGMLGTAGHVFRGLKLGTLTPFWLPDWPRNYLAVTGACLAIETKKFDGVDGFNEDFIMAGSDVVLGLDLYKKGYRNVYWSYAKLMHHESKSVISYSKAPITDYENSMIHYKPYLDHNDPYYNPNLSLNSEIPALRSRHEP